MDSTVSLEHIGLSGSPRINVQESAARYAFVAAQVRGLRVLDVACASGIGSGFLVTHGAQSIIGVERSTEALSEARAYSALYGAQFVQADAQILPFPDASFNVVVSLETIEHLQDPRGFIAECARILTHDGYLCLSTPNRTVTRWLPPNPFHVQEFANTEIIEIVGDYFAHVECFWQIPVFLPLFIPRKIVRRWLRALPGQRWFWGLWAAVRPRRSKLGATIWRGTRFDDTLFEDPYYEVIPAQSNAWLCPTYTILVATC